MATDVPSLSVCLIVKNEALFLPECLRSVRAIANEIVVVDTGSNDDTLKIAQDYQVSLFQYEFNDDFSQARNFALTCCQSDWILMLDADERISAKDFTALREAIEGPSGDAYFLTLRVYSQDQAAFNYVYKEEDSYPEADSYPGWIGGRVVKLFRNRSGFCYQNRVHESIIESILARGGRIEALPVVVHNVGHEKGAILGNQFRYLALLEHEMSLFPERLDIKVHVAQLYIHVHKQYDKARSLLEVVLVKDPTFAQARLLLALVYYYQKQYADSMSLLETTPVEMLGQNWYRVWAKMAAAIGETKEAFRVCEMGVKQYPKDVELWYRLANLHAIQQEIAKAVKILRHILEIQPDFEKAKKRLTLLG